jgi:hypothetical protein
MNTTRSEKDSLFKRLKVAYKEAERLADNTEELETIIYGKPTKAYLVRFYQMFRNQIKFVNGPCYKCSKMADDCYGGCCNEGTIGCRK